MNALWMIASNTLRQTVRQRLFYNVVVFGLGLVLFAMVVSGVTFGFPDRVVRSIGLSGVAIAVDLMALLIGVSLVHQEIDRKTLFVLLTRPLERWQYVAGRYLGLCGAIVLLVVGLSVVFLAVLTSVHGQVTSADLIALGMCMPEAAIIGAVGVVLSCFTTPTVGTGMGLGVWIIAASTDDLVRLTEGQGPAHEIAKVVAQLWPSLARLNYREAVVYQLPIALGDVAWAAVYGVTYSVALVALGGIILSRREMV